jgi:hypothetical protein
MKRNLSKFLPLGVIGIVVMLFLTSCDPFEDMIPTLIIKNKSNREIVLNYVGRGDYSSQYPDTIMLNSTTINLKPQETFCLEEGIFLEGPDKGVFLQEDFDCLITQLIMQDTFVVKKNSEQEEILRIWTRNFNTSSTDKEFYRLSDWKFKSESGYVTEHRRNDLYIFEIEDSDLISE